MKERLVRYILSEGSLSDLPHHIKLSGYTLTDVPGDTVIIDLVYPVSASPTNNAKHSPQMAVVGRRRNGTEIYRRDMPASLDGQLIKVLEDHDFSLHRPPAGYGAPIETPDD